MTLANTLQEKLSEWQPAPGRQSLAVSDPALGWAAHLTADRADAVGCLVWELTAVRTAAPPAGLTLPARAEGIAGRVTGLLEPLAVHEVDGGRGEALLRSAAPARRGDQVFYYEVLLRGTGAAVLRRYQAGADDGRRQQVAFALTHDALTKFIDDVTAK